MAVSKEQVRHVARLARLSLSAEDEEKFAGQLSAILDAIEELSALDTAGVEPTAHATRAAAPVFREDEPAPSLAPDEALAGAPARSGDFFQVPKIIE